MIYSPSNFIIERVRSLIKRRMGDADLAYLGNSHGEGARVDVPGASGYVYVHFAAGGVDENGFAIYSPPQMAWAGGVAYPNLPGCPVYVKAADSGGLEIKSVHPQGLKQAGIDASVLNPLNQQSKFVYLWQLTMGLASSVSTTLTASFKITVKSFRHYVGNTFQTFETPSSADMVDLEPYVPAADMHCYAAIWLDTYTNLPSVTTSTAQALTTQMDLTDIQELAANRPADAMPLKAFYLSNDQSAIRANARDSELRQVLNTPHIWGFPNVLSHLERVRPNRTLVTGPYTVSGVGAITLESGAQIIIVHKNNFTATTAPGTGNDSSQGYSIGSLWFDTVANLLYVATNVGVGTATWDAVAGSGGMTSWTLAADSGTPQAITNGNTATIEGGAGIDTAAGATDKVTVSVATGGIVGSMIATNTIGLENIVQGSPYTSLRYDEFGDLVADYIFNTVNGSLGENGFPLAWVIEDDSDGLWYLADTTAGAPVMGGRRGVILDTGGPLTTGSPFQAVVEGPAYGFTGLTDQAYMYASSTPGVYTQVEPSPALGGSTVLSAQWGWAIGTTAMYVYPYHPVRYMKRLSLADLATTTIIHHADAMVSTRKSYAAVSSNDVAVIETSGGAQDSSRQLRGQSGAGSTNAVDAAGANATALGDTGGTDFRLGQSFQVTAAGQLSSIVFRSGATTGTPSTTTVPYRIETDAAGIPSGTVLASGSTSTWVASADNTITITNGPFLVTGTTYWFVLELATMQATNNFYTVVRNTAGAYASGIMKWDSTAGASFPNTWAGGGGTNDMRVSITVAAVVVNDGLAQGVSHSSTTTASYADILLKRTGTRTGDLTLALYSSSAGLPNTVITNGTATTRLASDVTTGYTLIRFTWPTPPTITASTQYHLVLTTSDTASNTAYIEWGIDISSPPYANGVFALFNPTWANASPAADGLFDLYGATTTFTTTDAAGFWFSTKNDIVARFDNGSGSSPTTNTTFKNTSGVTLDVTCIVEMP